MSFMFKPLAYDDLTAINRPKLSSYVKNAIIVGNQDVAKTIIGSVNPSAKSVILVDGYVGSSFENFVSELQRQIIGQNSKLFDMKDVYLSEKEINELTKPNLPLNYEDDPVLLFGNLFDGKIDNLIDDKKLKDRIKEIQSFNGIGIVYGHGATIQPLLNIADKVVYILLE